MGTMPQKLKTHNMVITISGETCPPVPPSLRPCLYACPLNADNSVAVSLGHLCQTVAAVPLPYVLHLVVNLSA